jgi:acyl-CoA hydrolase
MNAVDTLAAHLAKGTRVAVGDGAGAPVGLAAALSDASEAVGGVALLLGWCFEDPVDFRPDVFDRVDTLMGGSALRGPIREGSVHYVPARYGSLPALLRGSLRPDVLVAGLVPVEGGFAFGTEVGWQHEAVAAGARVLAEVNHGLPHASEGPPLPADRVLMVAETERAPIARPVPAPDEATVEIARRVAELVPAGAALQIAPGSVGEAVLGALERPVRLHSGIAGDGARLLEERGLLLGAPRASYVVGGEQLYRWADGRPIASTIADTHGAALAALDVFVAVNTAFEVDEVGNVNAQGFGDDVAGGVGGLPDFAAAASRSPEGLSVIALATERQGASTLVEHLSAPATLGRTDVDLVVTECGVADLRGLPDSERRRALLEAWGRG